MVVLFVVVCFCCYVVKWFVFVFVFFVLLFGRFVVTLVAAFMMSFAVSFLFWVVVGRCYCRWFCCCCFWCWLSCCWFVGVGFCSFFCCLCHFGVLFLETSTPSTGAEWLVGAMTSSLLMYECNRLQDVTATSSCEVCCINCSCCCFLLFHTGFEMTSAPSTP